MLANIDFMCRARHESDASYTEGPTITLNEGCWAYCGRGASQHHQWERVPATTVAEIQSASHRSVVVSERESPIEARSSAVLSARGKATQ